MSSHRHRYDYWTWHNRSRLTNEKLSRRQHSTCRMTFCSFWLLIFSTFTSLLVYRFTDPCGENDSGKILFVYCWRYWLLLVTIGFSSLACCVLIVGLYKYLRARSRALPSYPLDSILVKTLRDDHPTTNSMPPYNYDELLLVSSPADLQAKSICYTTCVHGVDIWQKQANSSSSSFY